MSYYFSKTLAMPMDRAVEHVTAALASKGFGVLTTIDVAATMKKKLDVDFRPYVILGAIRRSRKALSVEDKVGTMLPCNFHHPAAYGRAGGDRGGRSRGIDVGNR